MTHHLQKEFVVVSAPNAGCRKLNVWMRCLSVSLSVANFALARRFNDEGGPDRQRLRKIFFCAIWSLVACLPCITLAAKNDPPASETDHPTTQITLFDGESLNGWDGDPRLWTVRDGILRGETNEENRANGNTFLIWTGGEVKDFELELSFRCTAANNSGIQYRSYRVAPEKASNNWVVRGYQHEIRNELTLPNVAGFLYDEGGSRGRMSLVGERAKWTKDGKESLETFLDQAQFETIFRLDDWNDVKIVARGNHLQHFLNGSLVCEIWDEDSEKARSEGVLALQIHAGAPMWVEYRSIRLKSLDE